MYPTRLANQLHHSKHRDAMVCIAAVHPRLGQVYWSQLTSCGQSAIHTLTTDPFEALTLPAGWNEMAWARSHAQHIKRLCSDKHQILELPADSPSGPAKKTTVQFAGQLAQLQRASGQSSNQFLAWVKHSQWADVPAAVRRASWSDEVFGWPTSSTFELPIGQVPDDFEVVIAPRLNSSHGTLH